jgi:dipeptidyl aminopeptidase/acylaminoacyl peptidase
VKSRLAELADVPFMGVLYPKLKEFVTQSSPDTHTADLKTSVFLFHAKDDSNVPFADSQKFADALRTQGKDVTFDLSETGDHYDAMISDGIPKAVVWLKERVAR